MFLYPFPNSQIAFSQDLINRAGQEPRSIQSSSPIVISRDVEGFHFLNKVTRAEVESRPSTLTKRFWFGFDFAMKGKHTAENKRPNNQHQNGGDNTGGQKRATVEE